MALLYLYSMAPALSGDTITYRCLRLIARHVISTTRGDVVMFLCRLPFFREKCGDLNGSVVAVWLRIKSADRCWRVEGKYFTFAETRAPSAPRSGL